MKLGGPISTSTERQKNKVKQAVKPENGFCSGFLDSEGVVWFGSKESGVSYNGTSFVHFTENDGLANDHVSAITEDAAVNILFGGKNGL